MSTYQTQKSMRKIQKYCQQMPEKMLKNKGWSRLITYTGGRESCPLLKDYIAYAAA